MEYWSWNISCYKTKYWFRWLQKLLPDVKAIEIDAKKLMKE